MSTPWAQANTIGNAESHPLNLNSDELSGANDGTLFASFRDVLEDLGEMEDCSGAFEELARLRRGDNGSPIDIRRLAEVCCEAWDNKVEENARKLWLRRKAEDLFSVTSEATGMGSTIDEPQDRNTENISKAQKKAADNIVNMFGVRGKHKKTRAHLLPNSRACNIFWGVVSDALSGIDMSTFSKEKKLFVRSEMARILARFKLDLFTFAEVHNSFYDLLEDGLCVMIIPLLTPEQIAEWKQGDKYEVLIFCSSKEGYKRLGTWRKSDNLNHMKWEDDGDLEPGY